MKDWFKARNIWGAAIMTLADDEAGRLMKAIWQYTMTGEKLSLPGPEKAIFAMILMTLGQDSEYEADVSGKRAAAGSAGGKQRVANQAIASFARNDVANQANATFASADQANQAIACNKNKNKNKNKNIEQEQDIKREKERLQTGFDLFWDAYPKKKAKQDALKAFVKLAPDEGLLDQMMTALGRQKQSNDWMRDGGQFIPYPATWLNGRRWEDEAKPQGRVYDDPKPTVAAQRYEQRDYSDREQQLMQRMINGFVEEGDDSG